MFLKPHQMYLESQGLYQKVCRLAQVRVELKALRIEEDLLVQKIEDAMCPATELVDLTFLRMQKSVVSEEELAELFVVRKEADGILTVHPAYVSDRFRPGNNEADTPLMEAQQLELFPDTDANIVPPEKEDEREASLPPAPLSLQEKEVEREEKDDDEEKAEETINVRRFIRFFNDVIIDANSAIPQILTLGGTRLEVLKARCHEYGKENVVKVIRKAAHSPFLNGASDSGWVASFDWLLKPNNFTKVLEGTYARFKPKHRGPSPEQIAANKAIEQQIHEELHRRLDEQRRNAVTYEEYLRMKENGEIQIEDEK